MEARVRIYLSYQKEQERDPVATLHISDRPGPTVWLFPLGVEASESRFGLKAIETEQADIREELIAALSKPVGVKQTVSQTTEVSTTRLVFATTAEIGSEAHWREAIPLLTPEARLYYDVEDYCALLTAMAEVAEDIAKVGRPALRAGVS